VIKNGSFNGFQWGHFCPKGAEREYFLYLMQQLFFLRKLRWNSKIPIKNTHLCQVFCS